MRRTFQLIALLLWGLSSPAQATATGQASDAKPMTSEAELLRNMEAAVDKGGYESALAMLQGVVEREPLNVPARFFLATAYRARQNYSACIEQVRAAEKLKAVDDRLLGILWVCFDESGQKSDALNTAIDAVERFPRSGESHRWYGISLLGQHKNSEARAHFQEALRLDADDATALYLLAQLYRMDGYVVPSFLTYLRFLAVEPDGNRARKARDQMQALLDAKLVLTFTGERQMEARLSVGKDGPTDEGDFREAQKDISTFAAATSQEPALTAKKLTRTLERVLQSLPRPSKDLKDSFTLQTLAPYFYAIRDEKLLDGLASMALPEADQPNARATDFVRWSSRYRWTK